MTSVRAVSGMSQRNKTFWLLFFLLMHLGLISFMLLAMTCICDSISATPISIFISDKDATFVAVFVCTEFNEPYYLTDKELIVCWKKAECYHAFYSKIFLNCLTTARRILKRFKSLNNILQNNLQFQYNIRQFFHCCNSPFQSSTLCKNPASYYIARDIKPKHEYYTSVNKWEI